MSETNIENEVVYVVYDKSESFISSFLKDLVTFGFLLICIYASRGSTLWTVVCGTVFVIFSLGHIFEMLSTKQLKLNGKRAAIKWAMGLKG